MVTCVCFVSSHKCTFLYFLSDIWSGTLTFFVGHFIKNVRLSDRSDEFRQHCNIGVFKSPKCDVNPQPNTWGIGPLVGRTRSGTRCSVMHVLAVIWNKTCHFFFICQYIFIRVTLSGTEICPLSMYPSIILIL